MLPLTKNQSQVFQIIKNFWQKNQFSPSLSELQTELLANNLKAKSKRSVVQYLDALVAKNYITRSYGERSIQLNNLFTDINLINIPILGKANAGNPLVFAEENIQGFIKVSAKLLKSVKNVFALQIIGDSMNKACIDNKYIEDRDYVVIDRTIQNIKNNDIVLAIVSGCATIKKFKKTLFGEIILLPESSNPVHKPIYIHESDAFFINGVVINVLKSAQNF